jgi:hypothetical protein
VIGVAKPVAEIVSSESRSVSLRGDVTRGFADDLEQPLNG